MKVVVTPAYDASMLVMTRSPNINLSPEITWTRQSMTSIDMSKDADSVMAITWLITEDKIVYNVKSKIA